VIARARQLCFPDALCLAAAGLCAAGMLVTGDGLVAAAQRSPSASGMNWHDRLLLGLWTFRLESALWFTLGLVVLWVGLGLGGRLGRLTETGVRVAGGVAIGYVLLAGAVLLGSTVVALAGSVGSDGLRISFSGRERVATWLLQASTAVAMATAWALAGGRLGERFAFGGAGEPRAAETDDEDEYLEDGAEEPEPEPEPLGGPPPAPVTPPAYHSDAVAALDARAQPGQVAAASAPTTPSMRARRVYEERLSFSPKRADAQALLEQVVNAERAGRIDEAESLADRLGSM
jgi:hypothetical protein